METFVERCLKFVSLEPLAMFVNVVLVDHQFILGDLVCLSQGDEFHCPTEANMACDVERCPLQGPSIAPIKESEIAG